MVIHGGQESKLTFSPSMTFTDHICKTLLSQISGQVLKVSYAQFCLFLMRKKILFAINY